MSSIRLSAVEAKRGALPGVCIVCGSAATTCREKKLNRVPTSAWVFFFVILAVVVVVPGLFMLLLFPVAAALNSAKTATLKAPLCNYHYGHWTKRTWTLILSPILVVLIGFLFVTASIMRDAHAPGRPDVFVDLMLFGWWALVASFLILNVVLAKTAVRAREITPDGITLIGVSPLFVQAVIDVDIRAFEESEFDGRSSAGGTVSSEAIVHRRIDF